MEQGPGKEFMYMFIILTSVFSTAAVILNGILITVIAKNKTLQQVENTFIVNLAFGDILLSCCGYGSIIIWNERHRDVSVCLCFVVASSFATGMTLFFLSAMTLAKYVQILYPFHYTQLCTKRNVILITITIHASCVGLIASSVLIFQGNNMLLCSIFTEFSNDSQIVIVSLVTVIILLVAFTNIKILYVSRKKRNDVEDLNRTLAPVHGIKVLAVLVMFTFVLYIPFWTFLLLKIMYEMPQDTLDNFALCAALSWFVTPVVDGIAFLFCRQDIRKYTWKMLRCM